MALSSPSATTAQLISKQFAGVIMLANLGSAGLAHTNRSGHVEDTGVSYIVIPAQFFSRFLEI